MMSPRTMSAVRIPSKLGFFPTPPDGRVSCLRPAADRRGLPGARDGTRLMKRLNEQDWPQLVRPGSRVFLGGGASVPFALVASMLGQAARLRDIEIVHIHGLGECAWIDPAYGDVLRTNSFFLTPALREAARAVHRRQIPTRLLT